MRSNPPPIIDVEAMRRLPLLSGLAEPELRRVLASCEIRSCGKGTTLFKEGSAPECLFVLLEGMVELFTTKGKRDAVVLIVWPPETFLPAAALTDEPYLLSARTLSASRLLALDAAAVREEVQRCPALMSALTRILGGQFRMAVRHIKDLKLRSGSCRLGAFLLRIVNETGTQGCADLPVSKAVLASRLGLTPETLSRSLHVLRDRGMTVRGSRIILTDREKLERFCAPDPLIDGRELALSVTAV